MHEGGDKLRDALPERQGACGCRALWLGCNHRGKSGASPALSRSG